MKPRLRAEDYRPIFGCELILCIVTLDSRLELLICNCHIMTTSDLYKKKQEKRKTRRSNNIWCRDLEADANKMGKTWGQLENNPEQRDTWMKPDGGLCPGNTSTDEIRWRPMPREHKHRRNKMAAYAPGTQAQTK
ncbi:hypothetical protein BgiBS90_005538 [Biomphalaria glabrata]|nr:hypothetical protein BgiBS90_005538 [Biomphalaria glabrata]